MTLSDSVKQMLSRHNAWSEELESSVVALLVQFLESSDKIRKSADSVALAEKDETIDRLEYMLQLSSESRRAIIMLGEREDGRSCEIACYSKHSDGMLGMMVPKLMKIITQTFQSEEGFAKAILTKGADATKGMAIMDAIDELAKEPH